MILLNVHPDISRGRDDVLALMFDMNDLWEQYAALQIRKHLRDRFTVAVQGSKVFMYVSQSMLSVISHGSLYVFFENYAILSTLQVQSATANGFSKRGVTALENDLQQFARQYMARQNNRPIPEFEGYSPNEMQYLLHDPFDPDSPLKLNVLDEADYRSIPMLNLIQYFGGRLKKTGEMKLTAKGFLPVKVVADLYEQGFYKEADIESGIVKLYKQTDSHSIDLTSKLSDISGLTKKRNNKLSLTKNGEKLLGNNAELLRHILSTFCYKFNWAYYDGYESEKIGQIGFAFSLVLLKRYGNKKRRDTFYAKKYFRAFPDLYNGEDAQTEIEENPWNPARRCYFVRTFERFLHLFGLVEIEKEKVSMKEQWAPEKHHIKYTSLFNRLIFCAPHRKYPPGHIPPGVPKFD